MSSYYYCSGGIGRHQPHFLHACSLCGKPLGFNSDIFMYRGNSPFCSKECRQEQIELDEAEEKKMRKVSSSARSVRKSESKNSTTSKTLPTGTVAGA